MTLMHLPVHPRPTLHHSIMSMYLPVHPRPTLNPAKPDEDEEEEDEEENELSNKDLEKTEEKSDESKKRKEKSPLSAVPKRIRKKNCHSHLPKVIPKLTTAAKNRLQQN
jgi:hypothetical protein